MTETKNKNILILWDNNSNCLDNQIFFLSNIITSAEHLTSVFDSKNFFETLIVPIELKWKFGATKFYNYTDLLGVKIIKEIVRVKYKSLRPILFISFFDLKMLKKDPQNDIITAVGHDFLQLPFTKEKLNEKLNQLKPLTELQLLDVLNSKCNLKGVIDGITHEIQGKFRSILSSEEIPDNKLISTLNNGIEKFAKITKHIISLSEANDKFIIRFEKEIINQQKYMNAVDFMTNVGQYFKQQISDEIKNNGTVDIWCVEKVPWKVLILDDEPESIKPLITSLEKRGITSVVTNRVKDAEMIIKKDPNNKIVIVISDYRLLETEDGIIREQKKQGYDFLFDLANKDRFTSLIALSGLNRKFLLESFQKYNARVDVYSKNDILTGAAINIFADTVKEKGELIQKVICHQPQGSGWEDLKKFYIAHRNSINYESNDIKVNKMAKDYVLRIESLLNAKNEEMLQLPPLPRISDLTAEMATKNTENPKHIDIFLKKLTARRIALWLFLTHGFNATGIYCALNGILDEQNLINRILKVNREDSDFLNLSFSLS